ncbi:hypothetical protein DLAC_09529 [Tieghemostelium lacteum]|uniref:Fe2OG dioxygenase domain-containing protein n=1 Tax=Tieghemostelium lacteum TaxID=361077 RepID=A0A151Z709_TIELA|nr:hypothetical protein DLAC_09529 [Tieghemostelium lacteum]|eukprot:KYQ89574.1 hypothetical protein DLAC_09529 [Tieghemostelium lacteum]
MADKLWQRIKQFVPDEFNLARKYSLNERLRFLRYGPGQEFKTHMDGQYQRERGPRVGDRSYVTVQLYLNEGMKGGETTFFETYADCDNNNGIPVIPKMGSVLIFQHDILHEGSILKKGIKYVMRTDVMYTQKKD